MSTAFDFPVERLETTSVDLNVHFDTEDQSELSYARLVGVLLTYVAALAAGWWLVLAWVPDRLTLHVAGRLMQLHDIHQKVLASAIPLVAVLPAVLWLECLVVGWRHSSARALLSPTSSMKTDIAFLLLDQTHITGLLGRVMMLGASVISGIALRDWVARSTGLAVDLSFLPLAAQGVVYFGLYSFFDYWAHRLGHMHWFWPLHRYHHAAEEFCVINGARNHPAGFIGIFLINVPMPVLGATPEVMIWVNIIVIALGFIIHSRIESGWGWIGRYVIQSPLHHRLHHKLDMSHATGFFGMIPIWDHLFGGWDDCKDPHVRIGVDTKYRHGFWLIPDLLRDYCDFWKGLAGRRVLSPSERRPAS